MPLFRKSYQHQNCSGMLMYLLFKYKKQQVTKIHNNVYGSYMIIKISLQYDNSACIMVNNGTDVLICTSKYKNDEDKEMTT